MAQRRRIVFAEIGHADRARFGDVTLKNIRVLVPYVEVTEVDCPDLDGEE